MRHTKAEREVLLKKAVDLVEGENIFYSEDAESSSFLRSTIHRHATRPVTTVGQSRSLTEAEKRKIVDLIK